MSDLVDVWITRTSSGWMVDAYVHATSTPAGTPTLTASIRHASLDDAHRWAISTFRHRIAAMNVRPPC